ncbi:MAG: APC family permease [Planctomycetes bacterium]|nr:APC family permease [Planctomycetota bacterium]
MANSENLFLADENRGRRLRHAAQVIIVGSVMFTFISYWRTAAVVLCDLASTAYYIGGIVEQAIGPCAPWFILAVMVFSYAVRAVYIESCSLFIRGGVYRVVREALGKFFAKLAVSALMFDYLLTGPISGVSAGQYLVGLLLDFLRITSPTIHAHLGLADETTAKVVQRWGSVVIACLITIYFYRQNLLGIHESSNKALKIMIATTIMAVIMLSWCVLTLVLRPANQINQVPLQPDLSKKWETNDAGEQVKPKINEVTGEQEDPLGFIGRFFPRFADRIRGAGPWFSLVGLLGILIAFGHSILAMSGEETLAQVYREVESPKLPNFKKAAFIVFIYSLLLTGGISFLAVLLIPNNIRMKLYADNLISGLAMNVLGPEPLRLCLNAFVVIVGFLILAGAVNTAIVGSNGVLNRVAEDGVMPDWFLKPHHRFGTTYRILSLIVGLQLLIIVGSQGNTFLLGEAYAFGVVWSFVFQAFSMVVLRFKDRRPREFKVPFNIRIRGVEFPIGLSLVLVILLATAVLNFLTKEVATVSGLAFSGLFFITFLLSERLHEQHRRGTKHEHLEQFNKETAAEITPQTLGLTRPYRKLVAIRSTGNLFMLEKALAETDPETTDVVVMTAKIPPLGDARVEEVQLDKYDQQLMTAVVQRAEKAGKVVRPLIVPTNNPLHAIIRTAKDLRAQELIVGASNVYTADEQLEQIAFYWISLHEEQPAPLTVRILGRDRDVYLDLGGGSRIPKISERKARSVAELRAAGVGVDRVLLVHHGSPANSDLFQAVLTALDPQVSLTIVPLLPSHSEGLNGNGVVEQDQLRARQLGRDLQIHPLNGDPGPEIVRLARAGEFDLLILPLPAELPGGPTLPLDETTSFILHQAPCRVCLIAPPPIPQEPEAAS